MRLLVADEVSTLLEILQGDDVCVVYQLSIRVVSTLLEILPPGMAEAGVDEVLFQPFLRFYSSAMRAGE